MTSTSKCGEGEALVFLEPPSNLKTKSNSNLINENHSIYIHIVSGEKNNGACFKSRRASRKMGTI